VRKQSFVESHFSSLERK